MGWAKQGGGTKYYQPVPTPSSSSRYDEEQSKAKKRFTPFQQLPRRVKCWARCFPYCRMLLKREMEDWIPTVTRQYSMHSVADNRPTSWALIWLLASISPPRYQRQGRTKLDALSYIMVMLSCCKYTCNMTITSHQHQYRMKTLLMLSNYFMRFRNWSNKVQVKGTTSLSWHLYSEQV